MTEIFITKIKEANERFELLKTNALLYPIAERLSIASCIRKQVFNDTFITDECNADQEAAEVRNNLISAIEGFQKQIINELSQNIGWDSFMFKSEIKDFSNAKIELGRLAEEEKIELKAWSETYESIIKELNTLPTHIQTINRVISNCAVDKYRILLLGEYQSGKTTTLNALCGGRRIGSIGKGVTTSAVPISVSYSENESCVINWKTPDEIKRVLAHIQCFLDDFDVDIFNLDNNKERDYWAKKIDEFRESKDCPSVENPDIRFLSLSAIILKYYGSPELQAVINGKITFSDIADYTKFPEDLETRWIEEGFNAFSFGESLFSFIRNVECFCPSETLKQLNCTVVDCPGLFSSSYDTDVTEQEMTSADAILYILPYEKQIAEQVCRSLFHIKNNYPDFHRKLFLVNNFSIADDDKDFLEKNTAIAKSMFGQQIRILPLDALLAYYGRIKSLYDAGVLSNNDIRRFLLDAAPKRKSFAKLSPRSFSTFNEAWSFRIRRYAEYVNCTSTATIVEDSGFNAFVIELEHFISKNKAYSVIYSNGINVMAKELSAIKSDIVTRFVEPYTAIQSDRIAIWKNRLIKAQEFKQNSENIISDCFFGQRENDENLVAGISKDVYAKLFTQDVLDEMLRRICFTIYANKGKLFKFRKDEEKIKTIITPLVTEVISSTIKSRFNYWNSLLETGQDNTFTCKFTPEIKILKSSLEKEWTLLYANDDSFSNKMENYVSFPKDTKDFCLISKSVGTSFSVKTNVLAIGSMAEIAAVASSIAMVVASYLCFLMLSAAAGGAITLSNPITFVLGMIGLGGVGLYMLLSGNESIEDIFAKKMMPEIKKKIEDNGLYSRLENLVHDEVTRGFQAVKASMSVDMIKMTRDMEIATATPEEEIEKNCFVGIDFVGEINTILSKYNTYANEYIRN